MLYTAFIFGLISSFHCIGMCGPIAMMLPVDRDNSTKKVSQILTYHLGRLTAYAIIGLIFGLLLWAGIGPFVESDFFTHPEVDFNIALTTVILLTVAGAFAGFVPAYKAAKIKPIVALRDE